MTKQREDETQAQEHIFSVEELEKIVQEGKAARAPLEAAVARLQRNFEQQSDDKKLLQAKCWASDAGEGTPRIITTAFAKNYYRVPQSVLGFPVEIYDPPRGEIPTDKPEDLVFAPEAEKPAP